MKRFFLLPLFFFLLTTGVAHAAQPECTYDGNPTRPGGECAKTVPFIYSNLDDYTTNAFCPLTPRAKVKSVCNAPPSLDEAQACGDGTCGYAAASLFINFDNATLGGFGPDAASWGSNTPDALAEAYPYNSLADKPLDITSTTPKEAFRTYWRLTPLREQLNAKANFFERFKRQEPPIFNSLFPYVPPFNTPAVESNSDPKSTLSPVGSGTAISPLKMQEDMQEFFAAGADGYLMWQYSGSRSRGQIFENDPYSIFSDDANFQDYCKAFQGFSDKSVGVNVWSAGDPRFASFLGEHMGILKNCGVNTIRIFAKAGGAEGVRRVLAAAGGIKVIIAVGDYSNGGGGITGGDPNWYGSGNKAEYNSLLTAVAQAAAGAAGSVKYIELANEPHCGGDASKQTAYDNWVRDSVARVHSVSGSLPVAIGQMATSNGACDQPGAGFISSNNTPGLAGTSAHYYDDDMKASSKNALSDSQSKLTRPLPFYIGEAGGGGASVDLANLPTFKISELAAELPGCLKTYPVPDRCGALGLFGNSPEDVYHKLNPLLKAKYDAFLPFDFDNSRSYIALQYINTNGEKAGAVLAENLPYVLALKDILSDEATGILGNIFPKWINNARNGLNNAEFYYPDITRTNLSQEELLSAESIRDNRYSVIAERASNIWLKDTLIGPDGCFSLGGPVLESPRTFPTPLPAQVPPQPPASGSRGNTIGQQIKVPIRYTATDDRSCDTTDEFGNIIPGTRYNFEIWNDSPAVTRNPAEPLTHWIARAFTVISNPKQDELSYQIAKSVGGLYNYSFVRGLLPQSIRKYFINPKNFNDERGMPMLGPWVDYSATNPNGVPLEAVGGKGDSSSGYIAREGGEAEMELCKLRNFWFKPAGLQSGEFTDCENPNLLMQLPVNSPPQSASPAADLVCKVKQHLFENTCSGGACYDFVTSSAYASSCPGKGVLNPALLIAIALNENGGLVSTQTNGFSPPALPHFGCFAGDESIEGKTSCAVNTLHKCDMSDEDNLKRYGYVVGAATTGSYDQTQPIDVAPLNSILNVLGFCSAAQAKQGTPCFSVWVSPAEALAISGRLSLTLPLQRQTWFNYYKGYLNDVAVKYSCSLPTP